MTDYPLQAEAEYLAKQPYDASDPEQVNKARKKAARELKEHLDYTLHIMSTPQGRKWIFKLLQACKKWDNAGFISQGNPHFAYFYLGEQNVGKYLTDDLDKVALAEQALMIKEAQERDL